MGKYCEICKKGVMSGNLVSHSNGTVRKVNVCTRCLRSGKVERSF